MEQPNRTCVFALGIAALIGCTDPAPDNPSPDGVSHVVTFDYGALSVAAKLDVLVVVDSSPAIAPHRDRLVASYHRFAEVFESFGGLPDLRLGVVTADLGGPNCGPGDGAAFRRAGVVAGDFLVDFPTSSSTRERNYGGDLGIAITALADAGSTGCATVQPLAAMKQALEGPSGFRRPNAYLAVVFVSAADDASPIAVDDAVTFLKATSDDPSTLMISVIGGDGTCATPATRLRSFADQFPDRNLFTSICAPEHQGALAIIGTAYRTSLVQPCIDSALADVDPVEPGAQFDCTVSDVYPDASGIDIEEPLAACDAVQTNRPCWQLSTGKPGCDGLAIQTPRPFPPVSGTRVHGQCLSE